MDEFLERFPDDPRAGEVDRLNKRLRCNWLREELRNKVRNLEKEETLYLEGMRLADDGQRQEAAQCFQKILDHYEGQELNAASRRLVERTSYMLEEADSESQ